MHSIPLWIPYNLKLVSQIQAYRKPSLQAYVSKITISYISPLARNVENDENFSGRSPNTPPLDTLLCREAEASSQSWQLLRTASLKQTEIETIVACT